MFAVTIESRIWGCGYRRTHRSRKSAFVAVMRDVMAIPDEALRPTIPEMISAYEKIGRFGAKGVIIQQIFKSEHVVSERGNGFVMTIVRG